MGLDHRGLSDWDWALFCDLFCSCTLDAFRRTFSSFGRLFMLFIFAIKCGLKFVKLIWNRFHETLSFIKKNT